MKKFIIVLLYHDIKGIDWFINVIYTVCPKAIYITLMFDIP